MQIWRHSRGELGRRPLGQRISSGSIDPSPSQSWRSTMSTQARRGGRSPCAACLVLVLTITVWLSPFRQSGHARKSPTPTWSRARTLRARQVPGRCPHPPHGDFAGGCENERHGGTRWVVASRSARRPRDPRPPPDQPAATIRELASRAGQRRHLKDQPADLRSGPSSLPLNCSRALAFSLVSRPPTGPVPGRGGGRPRPVPTVP